MKIQELKEKINLIDKYNKLFEVLLSILKNEDFIEIKNSLIITKAKVESLELSNALKDLELFKKNLIKKYADMSPHFNLLEISINNYLDIFQGKKTADEVLFPLFSIDLVKDIFTNNILADYFNETIALLLKSFIEFNLKNSNEKIKILEIGSGTGGTSLFFMNKIAKFTDNIEFYFTDLSNVFIKKAKKLYSEKYNFTIFKKLDIENLSDNEDFESNSFDAIFASNVIHSTKSINNSLKNVYTLLKNKGIFIINEVTKLQDFVNLTFGLMEGWWKFEDPEIRIPISPLLSIENWEKTLALNSFKNIKLATTTHQEKKDSFSQSIIISQK
jgi:ubiquinone/menaquinone biosynthesis C-methylase UbiE